MTNARRLQIAIPWLVGVGLFAVWELACRVFEIPPFVLPRPSAVFATMYDYRGPLLEHSLHTLFTTIIGFVLAVAGGTAIGLAVGASSFVYVGLYPVLIAFNSIPKVALVPVIFLFLATADWRQPLRSVGRPLAIPAAALVLAFGTLYCLER